MFKSGYLKAFKKFNLKHPKHLRRVWHAHRCDLHMGNLHFNGAHNKTKLDCKERGQNFETLFEVNISF